MKFVVRLHDEVWLAPWSGDPGRTLVQASAGRFANRAAAEASLSAARRRYRPYPDATIEEVAE